MPGIVCLQLKSLPRCGKSVYYLRHPTWHSSQLLKKTTIQRLPSLRNQILTYQSTNSRFISTHCSLYSQQHVIYLDYPLLTNFLFPILQATPQAPAQLHQPLPSLYLILFRLEIFCILYYLAAKTST